MLRAPVVPSLQSSAAIASGQAVARTLPMRRAYDACSQQSVVWVLQACDGGGLSQAALQQRLQQQRRESLEKLDRGVCALKAKDPKVRELMENTEKFLTTTEIGNDMLTVLLYPPTECRKTGRSLG